MEDDLILDDIQFVKFLNANKKDILNNYYNKLSNNEQFIGIMKQMNKIISKKLKKTLKEDFKFNLYLLFWAYLKGLYDMDRQIGQEENPIIASQMETDSLTQENMKIISEEDLDYDDLDAKKWIVPFTKGFVHESIRD